MSPVIGHGHYKRPYRITWKDSDGKNRSLAFHWSGPWEREAKRLMTWQQAGVVTDVRAWDDRTGIDAIQRA